MIHRAISLTLSRPWDIGKLSIHLCREYRSMPPDHRLLVDPRGICIPTVNMGPLERVRPHNISNIIRGKRHLSISTLQNQSLIQRIVSRPHTVEQTRPRWCVMQYDRLHAQVMRHLIHVPPISISVVFLQPPRSPFLNYTWPYPQVLEMDFR
jgi:hypothetical protein